MSAVVEGRARVAVVALSLALLYFTVPHMLEDFAVGEPQQKGVPAPALSFVISTLVAAQAAGLYWLGRGLRRGLWVHAALGVVWPLAAGFAQVPVILADAPYRSGAVSVAYVAGIIAVGLALAVASLVFLRRP